MSLSGMPCDAQAPGALIERGRGNQPRLSESLDHPPTVNRPAATNAQPVSPDRDVIQVGPADAKSSVQWLADLAVRKIPKTFDGDKDWGNVKKIWAGVKVRRDGFRLKTNRRFRDVNHGRWIRYELSLVDTLPAVPTVTIEQVTSLSSSTDSHGSDDGWQIQSTLSAPMRFTARIERWNYGLQWYSVSVSGHLRIRLRSSATIRFTADYTQIPPALVIDPYIEQAEISLDDFEVERISKIGGDVAEAWGEIIQTVIRERIRRKENASLAEKMNRAITKHRDDLRLSMFDAATGWFDTAAAVDD